jgi:class 3 adenylate cyclase
LTAPSREFNLNLGAAGGTTRTSDPEHAERKLATVLFADLVSSTELGASQDPERTRAMLDRFYDAMADEISRAAAPLRSSRAMRNGGVRRAGGAGGPR